MTDTTDPETRPRTFGSDQTEQLQAFIASAIGASSVAIHSAALLSGGAICENWHIVADVDGGRLAGRHHWVLRTDAAARMAMSHDRLTEFEIIRAAHQIGVAVPHPIAASADLAIIGAPFMVVGRVAGSAQARKLVRDPGLAGFGEALAGELGRQLARLHRLTPSTPGVTVRDRLPLPGLAPGRQQAAQMRGHLDNLTVARPALEYVIGWLDRNAPEAAGLVLCHGDFRTGNYMVDNGRLSGLLDWEFAHWGDRHEDIAWLTARCWRFGAVGREAGGIGSRAAFYAGYEAETPGLLDSGVVGYWEVLSAARWAVVALLQGERHLSGGEVSLELNLTGMMAPEMEYEALKGIEALERGGQGG